MADAIFDPITEETKRKRLSIGVPIVQPATSRLYLQPAHGLDYVSPQTLPQAPGIGYIPAPAQEVTRGMGIADVSSKPQGSGDLPLGFTRDAAGTLRPSGQSTLAGTIIPAAPVPVTSPAPVEQASPAGKPVGPVGATLTETQVPSAAQSRMEFSVVGPGTIEPNRFVPRPDGGLQINPEAPGLVNYARRAGIGIEGTGPVPGGSFSQYSVSDPAAVEKRREEGRVAIDQLNTTLDRANILEGAHGPEEAARAQARIAGIDAVRSKGQADQKNTELELAKAKVSMAKDISDIQKNQADIMKKGSFDEETDYKANLSALKDPGAAQWLTAARKNIHAGTHEWTDNSISMYDDAGESSIPVKIQGAVPKQFTKALSGTMAEYEQAKKLLEENSGLFDSTSTYRAKLLGIQDKFKQALAAYGLRIEPVEKL